MGQEFDPPNPADIIFQVEIAAIANHGDDIEFIFKKIKSALKYGTDSADNYQTFYNTILNAKGKISIALQQTMPSHYLAWLLEIELGTFLNDDLAVFNFVIIE